MARRSKRMSKSVRRLPRRTKRLRRTKRMSKSKRLNRRKPRVSKLGKPVKRSKSSTRKPRVSKLGTPVKRTSKRGPSPYNKFVKKMSPVLRKANPGMKQPNIMKLIAKEWKASK